MPPDPESPTVVEARRLPVVSELVSNAIKAHVPHASPHAGTESPVVMEPPAAMEAAAHASPDHIWLDLYPVGDAVVLRVWDACRTPPVLRAPDLDDEGGRGLCLVDLLAWSWGYYRPASGGKIVWCTLAVPLMPPRGELYDHRHASRPRGHHLVGGVQSGRQNPRQYAGHGQPGVGAATARKNQQAIFLPVEQDDAGKSWEDRVLGSPQLVGLREHGTYQPRHPARYFREQGPGQPGRP
ncbi:ATP-binding protein [Streptosporangium canum]|uniref:ATP-binding protein n=1 Tax=Streptosporangium canum TaxID=324952 RepID=UPI0034120B9C